MHPHSLANFFGTKLISFRQIWLDLGEIWKNLQNLCKFGRNLDKSD